MLLLPPLQELTDKRPLHFFNFRDTVSPHPEAEPPPRELSRKGKAPPVTLCPSHGGSVEREVRRIYLSGIASYRQRKGHDHSCAKRQLGTRHQKQNMWDD